jgi:transcriptional regulator with PAS, ATPase and Fis domain
MNTSVVQSMINAIDKPAIFITPEYTIHAVNDAYRDIYEKDVIIGKSRCFEISHSHNTPCDKHGEDCPIQQCSKNKKSTSVVHIHNTELGKSYCDILMKPVFDEDKNITGYLEILDRIEFASTESETDKMIGKSQNFKNMLTKVNRAAKSEIAVLLHGETGTGKELVSKALHETSRRSDKPFVIIECTGLNENLFESELFGHEKGAFTGATYSKKGLIEIAKGGTVFFDEIADVPLSMQVKLLRLLETKCYRTVGGIKQLKADFRLICASHKNLLELVEKGEFRRDLYYRIAGFPITLPSLADRREDIPALAKHFLAHSELHHKRFSKEALSKLSQYKFPGNIRELKNIVEQSALMANEDLIETEDLPERILNELDDSSRLPNSIVSLGELEERYLQTLCENQNQPIDELAKTLGVSTRTLYRKLQKHDLKYDK